MVEYAVLVAHTSLGHLRVVYPFGRSVALSPQLGSGRVCGSGVSRAPDSGLGFQDPVTTESHDWRVTCNTAGQPYRPPS